MQQSRISSFLQIKKAIECIAADDLPDGVQTSEHILHLRVPKDIEGYRIDSDDEKSGDEEEEESGSEDEPRKKKVKNIESDETLLKQLGDFYYGPSFCATGWVKPYDVESRLILFINKETDSSRKKSDDAKNWVSCGPIVKLDSSRLVEVLDFKPKRELGNTLNVSASDTILSKKTKIDAVSYISMSSN